jgi:histone-lysine N-methyltransferase SETD2
MQDGEEEQPPHHIAMIESLEGELRPLKKPKWEDQYEQHHFRPAPKRLPSTSTVIVQQQWPNVYIPPVVHRRSKDEIAAVIAAAKAAAEAEAAKAPPPSPPPEKKAKKERPPRKTQTTEEKEANKEKRLLKLVGAVVVKCMSKYSKQLDHDQFKKYAKEVGVISRVYKGIVH